MTQDDFRSLTIGDRVITNDRRIYVMTGRVGHHPQGTPIFQQTIPLEKGHYTSPIQTIFEPGEIEHAPIKSKK